MPENNGDKESRDLELLRRQIDELDHKIVEVLNARAEVVIQVGKTKRASGGAIYAPDREKAVLKRVAELNKGPLPPQTLQAIYRELMSGSFALEKPLRIGYLGPAGSFSHMAAMRKFGASVEYLALADIRAVFEEVSRGHADLGLAPIENSVGGGVIDTMDAFVETDVRICAEVYVEVRHNLLANCSPEKIKRIASKPEVFAQCRNWLARTELNAELVPVASSAKAAEMAAGEEGLAAIGSLLAAELYGLKVVFADIQDAAANMTRFFVISKELPKPTGNDKTSLMFATVDKPGALVEVLNVIRARGINMSRIDSRPSKRRNWEYYFFVDCLGHAEGDDLRQALAEAREHCLDLHVLGSYPRSPEPI